MIRLSLAALAMIASAGATKADEMRTHLAMNQNGKSNIIVVFDNNKIIDVYDLDQMGRMNISSVMQVYGEQYVHSVQKGYANYSHVMQTKGEHALLILSQSAGSAEPVWVNTTLVTKEAVADSFLWHFMSGDLRVSVFAEDRQVSVLGRSH